MSKAKTVEPIKPKLPEEPIVKTVSVEIEVKLASDFERYSNGTMVMSISSGYFTTGDGTEGRYYVGVGGESVDIKFGERTWRVKTASLVEAAIEADKIYLAEVL